MCICIYFKFCSHLRAWKIILTLVFKTSCFYSKVRSKMGIQLTMKSTTSDSQMFELGHFKRYRRDLVYAS